MKPTYIYSGLLCLILSLSFSYVHAQFDDLEKPISYVPGQVLIKLKQGKSPSQQRALRSQLRGSVTKQFPQLGIELWTLSDAQSESDLTKIISQYEKHPDIEFIEPNYIVSTNQTIPNDPDFWRLYGQNNTGQTGGTPDADIDAPEAWDIATESPNVVVAIIDTGVDWGHEDLVDNIWQNLGEDADGDGRVIEWNGSEWIFDPGDENNIDDDGNGYIDDFVGWDFHNNDNNPFDDNYHGTHVAGTVGASGNNNIGVVGVTWNVQLAALKFMSDKGSGSISDAAAALNYAVAMGMPISNNSWGYSGNSFTMFSSVQNADANGHLFIAAAGNNYENNNDNNPYFPCSFEFDHVVSVASTTNTDDLSIFSNVGSTSVDLGAPGSRIHSCLPLNEYGRLNGTSMASPQVAGACALLWGQFPTKTALEIKEAIINSTDFVPALNGKCLSEGRLNVYKTLTYFNTPNTCRSRDSLDLVVLYNATSGANWTTSWNLNQAMSNWAGVTLDATGCVVELDLSNNQLTGTVPSELGSISGLTYLNLSGNALTGNIPFSIVNLTNLVSLDLHDNQFSGSIPKDIGDLINLNILNLQNNQLDGIPAPNIARLINLTDLYLANNNFIGRIPFRFANLTNLEKLTLQNNQFSGCYHADLAQLCTQLEQPYNTNAFISNGNNFDETWENFCNTGLGECPIDNSCRYRDSLSLLTLYNATNGPNWNKKWDLYENIDDWFGVSLNDEECVVRVSMGNNNITGVIPSGIGDLIHVRELLLFKNNLSGSIPSELSNLSTLKVLFLSENQLSGNIPPSLGMIDSLVSLSLYKNQLSGSIPASLANLSNLQSLNLGFNNLSGNISPSLSALNQLRTFNVRTNNLTGPIPASFENLDSLKTLFLNENQLSGTMPASLSNLVNISNLNFTSNNLTGSIPAEYGDILTLQFLYVNDNQLSGCYDSNLLQLCPRLNPSSGSDGGISEGNNFDASWENFCTSSAGECSIDNSCRYSDSLTLVSLYNAMTPNGWPNSWDLNQPIDTWYGVTLNSDDCVEALNLNSNNLTGIIPSSLGNLNSLISLDLGRNSISGSVPSSVGNLTSLRTLILTANNLTGQIPSSFGNLSQLRTLRFGSTQISGSIPKELGNLSNLVSLTLTYNSLSGCYHPNLAQLCTQLNPNDVFTGISAGNNFDATWDDFCNNGAGSCLVDDSCRFTDSLTLVTFYEATDGDNWTSSWDLNQPMDNWQGVGTNEAGCVVSLLLFSNQLKNSLPAELGNLMSLQTIMLNNNELTGSIPSTIGNLSNLTTLFIPNNQLSGSIPSTIGNLSNLTKLLLSGNNLSGPIPSSLGNLENLTELKMTSNNLSGNIPPELANMNSLTRLHLANNQLSGSIPAAISNLNLDQLVVYNNQLSGCYELDLNSFCSSIMESFNINEKISVGNNFDAPWEDFCSSGAGACTISDGCRYTDSLSLVSLFNATGGPNWTTSWDLSQPLEDWHGVSLNADGCVTHINLHDNQLIGSLPPELGNLTYLKSLSLYKNQLNGSIPSEIGNLTNLQSISLSSNQLSGSLPSSIGNLANLSNLSLYTNQLSGSIPQSFGNLSSLTYLSINSNNLSGTIPSSLGNLLNLTNLNLNGNNLSGTIPSSLGNLINLKSIFLNRNQLSGTIPTSLANLVNLSNLNLSSNNLSGTIPPSLGNIINLKYLTLNSNQLSGKIPVSIGNLVNLTFLNLSSNNLNGPLPAEFNNLVNLQRLILSYNELSGCYESSLVQFCSTLSPDYNTNASISNGNNFDAPWEDFCNNNAGACQLFDSCRSIDSLTLVTLYNATGGPNWTTSWDLNQPIDEWHGVLTNPDGCVSYLNLHENQLVGNLPSELGNLSQLTGLVLYKNQLTGNIPSELGNLSNLLSVILSSNNLTGPIPSSIGNLSKLKSLSIYSNQLSGAIPSSLGNLSALTGCSLNSNNLSGTIPTEIGNLVNLTSLNFSNNNLSGPIPSSLGSLINMNFMFLNRNQLSGPIPSSLGNLVNAVFLNLSSNNLSGCYESNLNQLCPIAGANISNGNNFDATWEDFCGSGAGACELSCPPILDFTSSLPDGIHHAGQVINISSTVPSGYNPVLKAGNEINILAGFSVQQGSTISFEIEGCN